MLKSFSIRVSSNQPKMATRVFSHSLLSTKTLTTAILPRSLPLLPSSPAAFRPLSLLRVLRPLAAASNLHLTPFFAIRSFATRMTSSSLNDPSPNWSNRPPKETILLDGCDFEHWLVVMEKPEGDPTRDEIIDSYIKTLAMVVGSEEEARMKIYSVSTRCYFAFGALVSEELSYKIKELPRVRWVLPDSYLDVRNKDYGGEPFINGQAVPYDPKYHEEWIRNNARADERNRRNKDRPRNFDRSRNYERRRENMQRNMQAPNQGPPNNYANVPQPSGPPPQQNNYNAGPPPQQSYNAAPSPQQNYNAAPPPQQNYNPASHPQQNCNPGPPPLHNYNPGPPPQHNYNAVPPPPQYNNYPAGPPSQQNFQSVHNNGHNFRG